MSDYEDPKYRELVEEIDKAFEGMKETMKKIGKTFQSMSDFKREHEEEEPKS